MLSSAQGCRFCSAKSDELCRQSGSEAAAAAAAEEGPAAGAEAVGPRGAVRLALLGRLAPGRAETRVSEASSGPPRASPPLGPASPVFHLPRASPPLGAPVLEPRLDLRVGHAQGLGQRPRPRPVLLAQEVPLQLQHLRAGEGCARLLPLWGGPILVGMTYTARPGEGRERRYKEEERARLGFPGGPRCHRRERGCRELPRRVPTVPQPRLRTSRVFYTKKGSLEMALPLG